MHPSPLIAAAFLTAASLVHAADPVISEFMADNSGYLADEDGQFMDWIEVYNPGPATVDLQNWSLTDDVLLPQKWIFPSRSLAAGQSLVVWASGKDRTGAQLHSNFSLNDAGEYLALVKPDGLTKTSEWNPYPVQRENVSWGTAQQMVASSLLDSAAGKVLVPSGGGAPAAAWNTPGYTPDGSWTNSIAPPGIGYDTTVAPPLPTNIAPAGTASQSTTNAAFSANLATDGVLTNFTHTAGADNAAFWNVDFGATATLNSVTLRNRGDGCCPERLRDITITILDGSNTAVWTSALLNPDNTGFTYNTGPATLTVDLVALTGGPVPGRHVRVSRTADPDGSGIPGAPVGYNTVDEQNVLSLGEVTIMGFAPSSIVNLARTGTPAPVATQSSNYSPTLYLAPNAINGLNNDFTHTVNTDLTPWWQVNLNRRAAVSTVNMHNREGCCPERLRDMTVTILDSDGTTVVHTSPVLNPLNALGGPADLVYDAAANNGGNPVFGQYVKISRARDLTGGLTADDAVVISLSEVQVRGTELNGYRPHIRTDIQTAMQNNSPTAYWRLPFTVANPAALTGFSLRVRYDDGFLAYLNGTLIASRNAPGSPDQNSTATANRTLAQGLTAETIDLGAFIGVLTPGSGNVLAIHGLNFSAADDNFMLQPELLATSLSTATDVFLESATPGALNNSTWYIDEVGDTVFSHRRGFYDAPFNLAITSPTPGVSIYYTLNNSEPTTSSTLYTGPIAVSNPGGSYSGTRVVRARAFKANWKSTNIDTHTYIFLDNVLGQTKGALTGAGASSGVIPSGWPTSAANNGGQAFNFGFTPGVTVAYSSTQIRTALTQIPSISVVTQQNNLTDPVTGIYVNGSNGHGEAWERPASIEMLDFSRPGATPEAGHGEFSDNVGLRLRGGASRQDNYVKHSFRVFWRGAYGNGKLNYRVYGPDGAGEFETFDLRGSQNYAWSTSANDSQETLVRDPFCRELMGAMGQNWTRSRFVHLYLNGLYWGIFEIHERPENSYGQTYLGGDKDNYDVVKNHDRYSGVAFSTEATDGYLLTNPDGSKAAWKDLWDRCLALPANPSNENYFRILGCNPDGSRNPAYPVLLDVDNLIAYTLALFYSGDGDACLSGFLGFNQPNNWHGMRDRMGTRGFSFFNHDAEHTLRASSWSGSRAQAATDQTGPFGGSNQSNFTYSNPQWMHEELMSSPEYRLRYADHIRRHFFNNGALTPASTSSRWTARANTINNAIVAYAGRYCTAASAITTWNNLVFGPNGAGTIDNIPADFLATRTADLLNQLRNDGLYPNLAAADFSQHGGNVAGGYALTMTAPAGAQIFYTLDGSDPRAIVTEVPAPFTYAARNNPGTRYKVTGGATDGFSAGGGGTPPTPDPVSRWTLNGNATDSAGGGNNGSPTGAPVFTASGPDGTGQALTLNGTSQYVAIGNPANLQIVTPSQITMSAWVKPTVTDGLRNILNKGHNLTPSGEVTLRIQAGALETGTWNGTNFVASAPGAATLNQWQHICGVFDGGAWRLYKNGTQIASLATAQGPSSVAGSAAANNAWSIGSRGGSAERCFGGQIANVAIYNRGLSAAEVTALYNSEAGTVYTPDWKAPAYVVPGTWSTGAGGFGYDTEPTVAFGPYISTDLDASMRNVSSTLLTRNDFNLTPAQISNTGYLQLNVRYDDGFIAYLNGTKVAERNAPSINPSGASTATAVRSDAGAITVEKINISAAGVPLLAANNVLAIQGLNTSAGDNDMLLEAELVAGGTTPPLTGTAQLYTGAVTLNGPVTVNARVFQNGVWSALTSAFFSVATEAASASNVVISEMHYHPENPILPAELAVSSDKDEYEFIEVMNISPSVSVDLTGVRFTAGITTNPLGNLVLVPGERAVFVKNPAAFAVRYGALSPAPRILGTYTGSLSNQGEQVILTAGGGAVIRDFVFDDNVPWPEAADGTGMSLSLIAPLTNPDHTLVTSWRGSTLIGGSPGSSSFAAWKSANGITSDTDDGDHDGLNAVMEYVLGTQPGSPDSNPPVAGTEAGYPTFTLTYRIPDDATFTPQISMNLAAWSSAGIVELSSTGNGNGTVTTVWRGPVTVAAGSRLYFRGSISIP
jgi:hypothetical protein